MTPRREAESMPDTPAPPSHEHLRTWLVDRIAYYVQQPAQDIDTGVSLANYGLDSVYALALCGDIEDTLRVPIDPTLIWDIDTVDALASYLGSRPGLVLDGNS
jgi:acyl carrier protein